MVSRKALTQTQQQTQVQEQHREQTSFVQVETIQVYSWEKRPASLKQQQKSNYSAQLCNLNTNIQSKQAKD